MPIDQPKSPTEERADELRMTFGEHLEELRSYLIRAIVGLIIAFALTLYFGTTIVGWITTPLNQVQSAMGLPQQTIATDATVGFISVYLKVSIISALILGSPWVVWQLWRFISEGLYTSEKKLAYILAPFSTIMTVLGILFAYYILLPVTLFFFLNFVNFYPKAGTSPNNFMVDLFLKQSIANEQPQSEGESQAQTITESPASLPELPLFTTDPQSPSPGSFWVNTSERRLKVYFNGRAESVGFFTNDRIINPLFEINQYISFVTLLTLGCTIGFQLPVVMLIIGWTHLIDPAYVASIRKYAFFICFILGAILTPADVFSMLLLAVPLYALFEFGLLLMKLVDKPPVTENDLPG